ncbi:MAG: HAD-IIA family hydrolase [Actinomycetota bacterium]
MIADSYDAFLLDLDGVLYRGDEPVPGAAEAIATLRQLDKRLAFVTNNSARTPGAVVGHLASVGVNAEPPEVETSALTAAAGMRERGVASAFVLGEEGLREALRGAGIRSVPADDGPDAVVVGWDRSVTYDTLRSASIAVQRGAALFATNADATYPAPDGFTWPGAGSILAALEAATETRAEVFGKPNAPILRAALARAGGGRPLVIGDRISTDIEGARRLRWDSMLVLTGISTRQDLRNAGITATYVVEDLSALLQG